jgi:hypothetical protein
MDGPILDLCTLLSGDYPAHDGGLSVIFNEFPVDKGTISSIL